MRLIKPLYPFLLLLLISCNTQPQKLSAIHETLEVSYVNWACDCANFIETKFYKSNSNYQIKETDCIFIDPSNDNNKIPNTFYSKENFDHYLELTGQFYNDKGIPSSYEQKTEQQPKKAKVFRYDSFKLIKKNKNQFSN